MTDWIRCLWYKSENKATFFPQKNCNTYLIYGEIYERCWWSSQKSWKPNADTKTYLKWGWFSLGNKASWSWGQVLGMLSSHAAHLQRKEDNEKVADTPLPQVPRYFWSRTSPARQKLSRPSSRRLALHITAQPGLCVPHQSILHHIQSEWLWHRQLVFTNQTRRF